MPVLSEMSVGASSLLIIDSSEPCLSTVSDFLTTFTYCTVAGGQQGYCQPLNLNYAPRQFIHKYNYLQVRRQ
jgi:hypothetical protein